jgi:glycosyltransferase involved in cell wall biosynthesis
MAEIQAKSFEPMHSVLFVGSFLSKHQGTSSVSEITALALRDMGCEIRLCSSIKNKYFRLCHIFMVVLFGKYEIVHLDVFSGPSFKIVQLASFIAKKRGKRVFLNLRGGMLSTFYEQNQTSIKKVFNRSDKIISPSKFLQENFQAFGFQVEHLPNSVDLKRFIPTNSKPDKHTILWVRAFSETYCPEVVIETLRAVKKEFPNASLTMIGPDKGKRQAVEALIDRYHLGPSVQIIGPVSHDQLPSFYQSHSVFLNTTLYESFGNCVIEAAASGAPIVSNKVGELPHMWQHNHSILFVENNDITEFTQRISEIWQNQSIADQLVVNARKVAESYDRKAILKTWISIFE